MNGDAERSSQPHTTENPRIVVFALLYLTAAGVIYNLIAVGVVHLHDGLALALRILLGGGAFAILIVGLFAVINGLHRVTQA